MLDINPIKKEESKEVPSENISVNMSNQPQSKTTQEQKNENKKPMKTVGTDFMSKARSAPEPEFLESKGVSKVVFYFVLVATILVLAMGGYLYFLKETKSEELKTKEKIQADLEAKIAAPELAEVDELASRYSLGLDEISKLINKPVTYSLLFGEMEKIIPTDVVLTLFDINEKQSYKISAKGPDLTSTSKFIKALENSDYFESVFLSGDQLTSTEDETSYDVSAQGVVDEKMLIPKEEKTESNTQEEENE